ncbi:16S rRNA (guanine(527)-N(7))-methyltransferase RsmG [bacterium]|nr:16S rRNA (guanine(527)-N(7))-methyltransferase RsmG [bacterium]
MDKGKPTTEEQKEILLYTGWEAEDPRVGQLLGFIDSVRQAPLALVSHRDRERLNSRHILPSLAALPYFPKQGRVLDMGSGGGFPAVPLAIARPDIEFTLVDSTQKKTNFLSECALELGLRNVQVVWDRFEMLAKHPMQMHVYRIVTARAAGKFPKLLPIAKDFLAVGGQMLLWKARDWLSEGNSVDYGFVLDNEVELPDGSVLLLLSLKAEG